VIFLTLALLAFAVADLVRWSPENVSATRSWLALGAATAVICAISGLSGCDVRVVVIVGVATLGVLGPWLLLDWTAGERRPPMFPLAWILGVVVIAFVASGSADPIAGPLERWYSNLPFAFTRSITVDQFFLGLSAGLFLLATTNRVVRLVLAAAGTPVMVGETALRGGRVLGPMERLVVAAMVLAGDLTGAAVVIAAKGLLRLPEIRSNAEKRGGEDDQVTEYFLIGTLCSLLLAGGLAALVLGMA
jgi:hypothetical protein